MSAVKKQNKKVFENRDENFLDCENGFDESDTSHDGHNMHSCDLLDKGGDFEINRFFNQLPIRILNSHQLPFFYADDICKILGIKCGRTSLRNFTEREIVSQELRKQYNIVTYQQYKKYIRRNDKIILLTEFGVYRLIMNSRSELADQFRDFVYDVLYHLRTAGEYKVKARLEELQTINEQIQKENGTLKSEITHLKTRQEQFKNLCDEILLVEIPDNPYEIKQTNVPKKLLKKRVVYDYDEYPHENVFDDPIGAAQRIANINGISVPIENIDLDLDLPYEEIRRTRSKNKEIALDYIKNHRTQSYMITANPTGDIIAQNNVIHRVWVRNARSAMAKLSKLTDCRPDHVSKKYHWYSCDKQKIIQAMDAIID